MALLIRHADFDVSKTLSQYRSLQAYIEKAGQKLGYFEDIKQIVANQTSFAALSSDGKVWTWGDERYTSCLGREVTDTR
jgi:alpha-tubulin suppressor-like RCC1 family protein